MVCTELIAEWNSSLTVVDNLFSQLYKTISIWFGLRLRGKEAKNENMKCISLNVVNTGLFEMISVHLSLQFTVCLKGIVCVS